MRILHVLHAFPPESRAGSENCVEALATEQQRRHRVLVFHRICDLEQPEYQVTTGVVGTIPVVRINRTFRDMERFEDTYQNAAVAAAFGAVLDRELPDVVHFHHTTCLSTTCVWEAKARNLPVVYTLHDFWLLCPRGQRVRVDQSLCESHTDRDCARCMAHQLPSRVSASGAGRGGRRLGRVVSRFAVLRPAVTWLRKLPARISARNDETIAPIRARRDHIGLLCDLVDQFISPSHFLKEHFVQFGIPPARIHVLDNGFDLRAWGPPAERSSVARRRLRVAYLGTWIPTKGVHVLVEAFRGLDPECAVLDIHGHAVPYDGVDNYEGRLRRLARNAGHIRFRSRYTPEEIPRILSEVDALVVPSTWYENSPLTIHEAFLAGVPVVASNQGGMREFVRHEENGLTFRPGSPHALRAALRRLIDEPDLLERLRASTTPVLSVEAHAHELDRLYAKLRGSRPAGAMPVHGRGADAARP